MLMKVIKLRRQNEYEERCLVMEQVGWMMQGSGLGGWQEDEKLGCRAWHWMRLDGGMVNRDLACQ